MAVAQSFRNQNRISSSKVRLHLQTIFSHNPLHRSSTRSPSSDMTSPVSSATPSIRSSPSSSFSSFGSRSGSRVRAPTNDLDSAILSPVSPLSRNPTQPSNIRRQPSAIDLALQEERLYADEVETIGLGLFEPRPRANTGSSVASLQCSMVDFLGESAVTPAVLDSIFDVMERA